MVRKKPGRSPAQPLCRSQERIRMEIVSTFPADAALTRRKKHGFSMCSAAGSRSRDYQSNPHFQYGIALRHFPFETLRVPNHTACRLAEKTRFSRSPWAGRRCAATSPFAFFKGKRLYSRVRRSRSHWARKRPSGNAASPKSARDRLRPSYSSKIEPVRAEKVNAVKQS